MAAALAALAVVGGPAFAHEMQGHDAAFVQAVTSPRPFPFLYLGAKHMVTGYDHLLFLCGVVFLLSRMRDIILYASLFSLGHSMTLLAGVLGGFGVNGFLVDALIGISVAYKGFDNLDGFQKLAGRRPDPRLMILGFGLIHGLGLADKLAGLGLHGEGLLVNLLSFNLGVEIGQVLVLMPVVAILVLLRRRAMLGPLSLAINWLLMVAGFVLAGYQSLFFFGMGIPT